MNKKMPWLCTGQVIPACRTEADFVCALRLPHAPSLIILFGDINTLPDILRRAEAAGKLLLVHLDFLDGVGRDKAGMVFLANLVLATT